MGSLSGGSLVDEFLLRAVQEAERERVLIQRAIEEYDEAKRQRQIEIQSMGLAGSVLVCCPDACSRHVPVFAKHQNLCCH